MLLRVRFSAGVAPAAAEVTCWKGSERAGKEGVYIRSAMSDDGLKTEFMLAAEKKLAHCEQSAFYLADLDMEIDEIANKCIAPEELLSRMEHIGDLCTSLPELEAACERLFRVVSRAVSILACEMMPMRSVIPASFLCYLRCAVHIMGTQRVHTAFVACMCVMRAHPPSKMQGAQCSLLRAAKCRWGDVFDMVQATQSGHELAHMDLEFMCSASHAMRLLCSIPIPPDVSDTLVLIVIDARGANALVEQLRNFCIRPYLNFLQLISEHVFKALCTALSNENLERVASERLPQGHREVLNVAMCMGAAAMRMGAAAVHDAFTMVPSDGRIKYACPGTTPVTSRHFSMLSPGSERLRSRILGDAVRDDRALFALETAQMPPNGKFLLECIQSPLWGSERGAAAMQATFEAAPLSALIEISATIAHKSIEFDTRACMDACLPLWTALDPACVEDVILFATALLATLSCKGASDGPAWDPRPSMAAMGASWSDVVGVLRMYARHSIPRDLFMGTFEITRATAYGACLVRCVRDRLSPEDAADLLGCVYFSRSRSEDTADISDWELRGELVNMVLNAEKQQLLMREKFLRRSAFMGTCAMERLCSSLRPEDWNARGAECCVILTVSDEILQCAEARATLRVAAAAAPAWVKRIAYWGDRTAAEKLLHLAQVHNYAAHGWDAWDLPGLLEMLTPSNTTKSANG